MADVEPAGIERLPSMPGLGRAGGVRPRRRDQDGQRFDDVLRDPERADAEPSPTADSAPAPRTPDDDGPGRLVDVVV